MDFPYSLRKLMDTHWIFHRIFHFDVHVFVFRSEDPSPVRLDALLSELIPEIPQTF